MSTQQHSSIHTAADQQIRGTGANRSLAMNCEGCSTVKNHLSNTSLPILDNPSTSSLPPPMSQDALRGYVLHKLATSPLEVLTQIRNRYLADSVCDQCACVQTNTASNSGDVPISNPTPWEDKHRALQRPILPPIPIDSGESLSFDKEWSDYIDSALADPYTFGGPLFSLPGDQLSDLQPHGGGSVDNSMVFGDIPTSAPHMLLPMDRVDTKGTALNTNEYRAGVANTSAQGRASGTVTAPSTCTSIVKQDVIGQDSHASSEVPIGCVGSSLPPLGYTSSLHTCTNSLGPKTKGKESTEQGVARGDNSGSTVCASQKQRDVVCQETSSISEVSKDFVGSSLPPLGYTSTLDATADHSQSINNELDTPRNHNPTRQLLTLGNADQTVAPAITTEISTSPVTLEDFARPPDTKSAALTTCEVKSSKFPGVCDGVECKKDLLDPHMRAEELMNTSLSPLLRSHPLQNGLLSTDPCETIAPHTPLSKISNPQFGKHHSMEATLPSECTGSSEIGNSGEIHYVAPKSTPGSTCVATKTKTSLVVPDDCDHEVNDNCVESVHGGEAQAADENLVTKTVREVKHEPDETTIRPQTNVVIDLNGSPQTTVDPCVAPGDVIAAATHPVEKAATQETLAPSEPELLDCLKQKAFSAVQDDVTSQDNQPESGLEKGKRCEPLTTIVEWGALEVDPPPPPNRWHKHESHSSKSQPHPQHVTRKRKGKRPKARTQTLESTTEPVQATSESTPPQIQGIESMPDEQVEPAQTPNSEGGSEEYEMLCANSSTYHGVQPTEEETVDSIMWFMESDPDVSLRADDSLVRSEATDVSTFTGAHNNRQQTASSPSENGDAGSTTPHVSREVSSPNGVLGCQNTLNHSNPKLFLDERVMEEIDGHTSDEFADYSFHTPHPYSMSKTHEHVTATELSLVDTYNTTTPVLGPQQLDYQSNSETDALTRTTSGSYSSRTSSESTPHPHTHLYTHQEPTMQVHRRHKSVPSVFIPKKDREWKNTRTEDASPSDTSAWLQPDEYVPKVRLTPEWVSDESTITSPQDISEAALAGTHSLRKADEPLDTDSIGAHAVAFTNDPHTNGLSGKGDLDDHRSSEQLSSNVNLDEVAAGNSECGLTRSSGNATSDLIRLTPEVSSGEEEESSTQSHDDEALRASFEQACAMPHRARITACPPKAQSVSAPSRYHKSHRNTHDLDGCTHHAALRTYTSHSEKDRISLSVSTQGSGCTLANTGSVSHLRAPLSTQDHDRGDAGESASRSQDVGTEIDDMLNEVSSLVQEQRATPTPEDSPTHREWVAETTLIPAVTLGKLQQLINEPLSFHTVDDKLLHVPKGGSEFDVSNCSSTDSEPVCKSHCQRDISPLSSLLARKEALDIAEEVDKVLNRAGFKGVVPPEISRLSKSAEDSTSKDGPTKVHTELNAKEHVGHQQLRAYDEIELPHRLQLHKDVAGCHGPTSEAPAVVSINVEREGVLPSISNSPDLARPCMDTPATCPTTSTASRSVTERPNKVLSDFPVQSQQLGAPSETSWSDTEHIEKRMANILGRTIGETTDTSPELAEILHLSQSSRGVDGSTSDVEDQDRVLSASPCAMKVGSSLPAPRVMRVSTNTPPDLVDITPEGNPGLATEYISQGIDRLLEGLSLIRTQNKITPPDAPTDAMRDVVVSGGESHVIAGKTTLQPPVPSEKDRELTGEPVDVCTVRSEATELSDQDIGAERLEPLVLPIEYEMILDDDENVGTPGSPWKLGVIAQEPEDSDITSTSPPQTEHYSWEEGHHERPVLAEGVSGSVTIRLLGLSQTPEMNSQETISDTDTVTNDTVPAASAPSWECKALKAGPIDTQIRTEQASCERPNDTHGGVSLCLGGAVIAPDTIQRDICTSDIDAQQWLDVNTTGTIEPQSVQNASPVNDQVVGVVSRRANGVTPAYSQQQVIASLNSGRQSINSGEVSDGATYVCEDSVILDNNQQPKVSLSPTSAVDADNSPESSERSTVLQQKGVSTSTADQGQRVATSDTTPDTAGVSCPQQETSCAVSCDLGNIPNSTEQEPEWDASLLETESAKVTPTHTYPLTRALTSAVGTPVMEEISESSLKDNASLPQPREMGLSRVVDVLESTSQSDTITGIAGRVPRVIDETDRTTTDVSISVTQTIPGNGEESSRHLAEAYTDHTGNTSSLSFTHSEGESAEIGVHTSHCDGNMDMNSTEQLSSVQNIDRKLVAIQLKVAGSTCAATIAGIYAGDNHPSPFIDKEGQPGDAIADGSTGGAIRVSDDRNKAESRESDIHEMDEEEILVQNDGSQNYAALSEEGHRKVDIAMSTTDRADVAVFPHCLDRDQNNTVDELLAVQIDSGVTAPADDVQPLCNDAAKKTQKDGRDGEGVETGDDISGCAVLARTRDLAATGEDGTSSAPTDDTIHKPTDDSRDVSASVRETTYTETTNTGQRARDNISGDSSRVISVDTDGSTTGSPIATVNSSQIEPTSVKVREPKTSEEVVEETGRANLTVDGSTSSADGAAEPHDIGVADNCEEEACEVEAIADSGTERDAGDFVGDTEVHIEGNVGTSIRAEVAVQVLRLDDDCSDSKESAGRMQAAGNLKPTADTGQGQNGIVANSNGSEGGIESTVGAAQKDSCHADSTNSDTALCQSKESSAEPTVQSIGKAAILSSTVAREKVTSAERGANETTGIENGRTGSEKGLHSLSPIKSDACETASVDTTSVVGEDHPADTVGATRFAYKDSVRTDTSVTICKVADNSTVITDTDRGRSGQAVSPGSTRFNTPENLAGEDIARVVCIESSSAGASEEPLETGISATTRSSIDVKEHPDSHASLVVSGDDHMINDKDTSSVMSDVTQLAEVFGNSDLKSATPPIDKADPPTTAESFDERTYDMNSDVTTIQRINETTGCAASEIQRFEETVELETSTTQEEVGQSQDLKDDCRPKTLIRSSLTRQSSCEADQSQPQKEGESHDGVAVKDVPGASSSTQARTIHTECGAERSAGFAEAYGNGAKGTSLAQSLCYTDTVRDIDGVQTTGGSPLKQPAPLETLIIRSERVTQCSSKAESSVGNVSEHEGVNALANKCLTIADLQGGDESSTCSKLEKREPGLSDEGEKRSVPIESKLQSFDNVEEADNGQDAVASVTIEASGVTAVRPASNVGARVAELLEKEQLTSLRDLDTSHDMVIDDELLHPLAAVGAHRKHESVNTATEVSSRSTRAPSCTSEAPQGVGNTADESRTEPLSAAEVSTNAGKTAVNMRGNRVTRWESLTRPPHRRLASATPESGGHQARKKSTLERSAQICNLHPGLDLTAARGNVTRLDKHVAESSKRPSLASEIQCMDSSKVKTHNDKLANKQDKSNMTIRSSRGGSLAKGRDGSYRVGNRPVTSSSFFGVEPDAPARTPRNNHAFRTDVKATKTRGNVFVNVGREISNAKNDAVAKSPKVRVIDSEESDDRECVSGDGGPSTEDELRTRIKRASMGACGVRVTTKRAASIRPFTSIPNRSGGQCNYNAGYSVPKKTSTPTAAPQRAHNPATDRQPYISKASKRENSDSTASSPHISTVVMDRLLKRMRQQNGKRYQDSPRVSSK